MPEGGVVCAGLRSFDQEESREQAGNRGIHGLWEAASGPSGAHIDDARCQNPLRCAKLFIGGCAIMRSDMTTGSRHGWGVEAIAAL
jgi:hypothetical protein